MPRPKWIIPELKWGRTLPRVSFRFNAPFLSALKLLVQEERLRTGNKRISGAVVLLTLALRDERLRKLYKEQLALVSGNGSARSSVTDEPSS